MTGGALLSGNGTTAARHASRKAAGKAALAAFLSILFQAPSAHAQDSSDPTNSSITLPVQVKLKPASHERWFPVIHVSY